MNATDRSLQDKIAGLCLLALVCTWLGACAPKLDHYTQLDQYIYQQDYDSALKLMDDSKDSYKERNAALYYMEEGLLAHFAGRYDESNQSLLKAEAILEDLYTRSFSKQVASFVINDNTIPYRGEDFEDAMVNLFLALNYAGQGLMEDALVEARQVDNELNIINSRYEDENKNVYNEDAFIRFLMGVLYEANGEINDAFISYRKAEEIYRTDYLPHYGVGSPQFLIENLLSSGEALDFHTEIAEIQQVYPDISYPNQHAKRNLAEILVIHYNGLGPEKVEGRWVVPMPDGFIVKVAYPKFEQRNYEITHSIVRLQHLDSGKTYRFATVLMEDIGSIAVTSLDNRINRIKAKAVARVTTKYLATKIAANTAEEQAGSALAGLLVQVAGNIATVMTERADIRHWRLLPDEIRVGRMLVPAGSFEGEIDFMNAGGHVVMSKKITTFTAGSGEKKFITQRTLK